jgi:hypothetical protein
LKELGFDHAFNYKTVGVRQAGLEPVHTENQPALVSIFCSVSSGQVASPMPSEAYQILPLQAIRRTNLRNHLSGPMYHRVEESVGEKFVKY